MPKSVFELHAKIDELMAEAEGLAKASVLLEIQMTLGIINQQRGSEKISQNEAKIESLRQEGQRIHKEIVSRGVKNGY